MPNNDFDRDDMSGLGDSASGSISSKLKDIGRSAGRKAKKFGIDLLKRGGKSVVAEFGSTVAKVTSHKFKVIACGVAAGVFAAIVVIMAMGDVLTEERGTAQSYSLENEEMNVTGINEDGVRGIIALTEPQALKTAYYRLMSCTSYTKMVYDGEDFVSYTFYDPENPDAVTEDARSDFASLRDYNENERYFLLSADFIMMADEIMHDYTIYYPEQVIKPVYMEEAESEDGRPVVKTHLLIDDGDAEELKEGSGEDGSEEDNTEHTNDLYEDVVSRTFEKRDDGSYYEPTDNEEDTVSGIWDYGLGSAVTYEVGEKNVWREGTITTREVERSSTDANGNTTYWIETVTVNEPFRYSVPLEGKKDNEYGNQIKYEDPLLKEMFENNTDVYPIKIPLISSAALFSGSVTYNYEVKETRTPFSEGTTYTQSDDITRYAYTTDHNGNPLYETRDGETVMTIPEKVGEEKDVLGFEYIDDYYAKYVNYVPVGLENDMNFEERTSETYDLLTDLGLLKPYTGEIGEVMQGPAVSLTGDDAEVDDSADDYASWNDVTALAHLIAAEAGDSKLDELMVGAVAVNRLKNGDYTSIYDVVSEGSGIGPDRQYACFWTDTGEKNEAGETIYAADGGTWAKAEPTDREIASAKQALTGEFALPSNVVFQSQSQLGELFMAVAPHYYCYPYGQSLSSEDSFSRTALSAAQLKAQASQLEASDNESAAEEGEDGGYNGEINTPNGGIGGQKLVEVTYYCSACNDPPGSDAIAWSGGPSGGHAVAGETCAMSAGSREALGVEYGDWIYIDGIGTRRVEDLCGTGLGTSIKSDRIVVDIYLQADNGVCKCDAAGTRTATAYKTTGEGGTTQQGYYSEETGLYYVDINNPYGYELFSPQVFDTYSATTTMSNLTDPDQPFYAKWFEDLVDTISGMIDSLVDQVFQEKDSELDGMYDYYDSPSSIEKAHDVVYQALAITQNKLYSDVIANFNEDSMDLIFVGNYNPNGLFGSGMTMVNGTGTTIEGFVSPTGSYYQPSKTYSEDQPFITLSTPSGISVQAVYNGTVTSVAHDSGTVVIRHTAENGDTYVVTYGNIDPSVSNGASVKTEQVIGKTRDGGLTIKVEKDGHPIDPMSVFYQPEYAAGSSAALVQIAMNELAKHGSETYPGLTYQQAFGTSTGTPWCAYFVAYCAREAGFVDSDLYPWDGYCPSVRDWFAARGQFVQASPGTVIPSPGDPILFDWQADGVADHIGIVLYYDPATNKIHTIEGNTSNAAGPTGPDNNLSEKEREYNYQIMGFCKIAA